MYNGLFRLLFDLFRRIFVRNASRSVIHVRRFPPRKTFRAHLFGLTCGLTTLLCAVIIHFAALDFHPFLVLGLLIAVVIASIYFGSFVVLIATAIALYHSLSNTGVTALGVLSLWYMGGYIFGMVFALLYNDLVYLHLTLFNAAARTVIFSFDPTRKFCIIKSPIPGEITISDIPRNSVPYFTNELPQNVRPSHPFTLAFVANPSILRDRVRTGKRGKMIDDPIIHNLDLFLASVDQALAALEYNEVIGRPEIWSQMRITVLFDDSLVSEDNDMFSLVQPSQNVAEIDGAYIDNLLDPKVEIRDRYFAMLQRALDEWPESTPKPDIAGLRRETDVIFALSASPDFDRATSHFSDWIETNECYQPTSIRPLIETDDPVISIEPKIKGRRIEELEQQFAPFTNQVYLSADEVMNHIQEIVHPGELSISKRRPEAPLAKFRMREANPNLHLHHAGQEYEPYDYDPDPLLQKVAENTISAQPSPGKGESEIQKVDFEHSDQFRCIHEFFVAFPGRAAINVLTATPKTWVHEFAHAMSNAFHGAIADEYYDSISSPDIASGISSPYFYINRLNRIHRYRLVPVHTIFARYEQVNYFSDRDHPSARENWSGYFPARVSPYTTCIMDRNQPGYESKFDSLLSQFMYDRLMAKMKR